MCGRIAQYNGVREFVDALSGWPQRELFRLPLDARERYNIAKTVPVITLHLEEGTLIADLVRWGWRPPRATMELQMNARSETVAEKPFWRAAWKHRCVVPVDGWFEWPRIPGGGPKDKQAHYIRRRGGAPSLFAAVGTFPGIEQEPREGDGVAIVTADSLGGMLDVHDRRPVALSPELAHEWMDPATPRERAEEIMREGLPSEAFEWYPVDRAVGNPRNEGPHLVQPLQAPLI